MRMHRCQRNAQAQRPALEAPPPQECMSLTGSEPVTTYWLMYLHLLDIGNLHDAQETSACCDQDS